LKWLQEARAETGLKIAVEVAMPAHVNACLEAGVDILWIGSRTVVNPFSVSEIAEALKGIDIPVMVKNPVNPDLQLWIGALERLHHRGLRKLAGVHRGFSAHESRPYRNLPLWHIPIELRRLWPGLPVLTDPSHIAGKGSLVPEILQASASLGFDGFLIESHYRPESALTDRNQQLSPGELAEIIKTLKMPLPLTGEDDPELNAWRKDIDAIDEDIIRSLGCRMEIAELIGIYKRRTGMKLVQEERWREVLNDRIAKGTAHGLSRKFLEILLQEIHEESIRRQKGGEV
jgi:chorismate mutase